MVDGNKAKSSAPHLGRAFTDAQELRQATIFFKGGMVLDFETTWRIPKGSKYVGAFPKMFVPETSTSWKLSDNFLNLKWLYA